MAFNMRHDMIRDQRSTMNGAGGNHKRTIQKDNKTSSRVGAPVQPQRNPEPSREAVSHVPYDRDSAYDDMLSDRGATSRNAAQSNAASQSSQGEEFQEQEFEYKSEKSPYIAKNPEKVVVYWQGPEYEIYPKSRRWYVAAGTVIALIALYSVLTNSHIVAILFLIIGAVGFLYLNTPPRVLDYALTTEGVVVGNDFYYYDQVDSYWVIYEPPHTRVISLHIPGKLFPYIHVPLHQIDPVDMREQLNRFIPEIRQEKTLVDVLERYLHI